MKPISVIAIALLGFLLWSCSDGQKAAREQAEAEYRQGLDIMFYDVSTELPGEPTHYVRALEHFERAMAADSTFAHAYAMAVVPYYAPYWQLWDDSTKAAVEKKSRWALAKAIELGPNLVETQTAQAVMAQIGGETDQAERLFRQAVQTDPDYADARREYSAFLRRYSRFEEALAEAERAYRADSLAYYVCTAEADALWSLNRLDEAEARYRKCMDLSPRSLDQYQYLADLLIQKGDYDAAVAVTDQALQVGQDRPEIRNWRASALALKGDLPAALEEFGKTGSDLGIAWVQARMGNRAEAEKAVAAFESALASGQWWRNYDLAVMEIELGNLEVAMTYLEANVAANRTRNPHGMVDMGWWMSRSGLFEPLWGESRFKDLVAKTGYVAPD